MVDEKDAPGDAVGADKVSESLSIDPLEVEKFSALAEQWWDPDGEFKPLHKLNPTRLGFIRDRVSAHFGRSPLAPGPLSGLTLLDIGCGGGLLCEPLTRLGARVTGLDASARNIAIAGRHAADMGLEIDYRQASAEDQAAIGQRYDVVLAMEIVEHVADFGSFMAAGCGLVKPGGLLLAATLNRSPKAYLMAILGAEYLLRWLPRGTHDWRKFVRPSELASSLRLHGLSPVELTGVAYNPIADSWRLAPRDLDVNYMILAERRDGT